jgi:hypothetical protein
MKWYTMELVYSQSGRTYLCTFMNSVRTYSTINLYIQRWELGSQPVNLDIHEEIVISKVNIWEKKIKQTKKQMANTSH